jgi:hypothetical protein
VLLIKASFHKQIIRKKLELIVLVIQKKILYANAISGFIDLRATPRASLKITS